MARRWWLTPIILATQEAEIWRLTVPSQPLQIVHETLSQKHPSQRRAGRVAQGEGPEFKSPDHKKKRKENYGAFQYPIWHNFRFRTVNIL
jgi:hypothetical protein